MLNKLASEHRHEDLLAYSTDERDASKGDADSPSDGEVASVLLWACNLLVPEADEKVRRRNRLLLPSGGVEEARLGVAASRGMESKKRKKRKWKKNYKITKSKRGTRRRNEDENEVILFQSQIHDPFPSGKTTARRLIVTTTHR